MNQLANVKHTVCILSGKGGVGKSTITSQIGIALCKKGMKVGILDLDLCGPSIPRMLNIGTSNVYQSPQGWIPVYADKNQGLAVVSIAFFLDSKDEAVVWRGPKKNAMIKQFLTDVYWGEIDYLLIDTPPGTSDEHLAVIENIQQFNPDGAILITTPQAVAVGDVRRELTFCKKTKIPVLGIIENMSGYVCPHCSECTNIFSKGGGEALANMYDVPFLGNIPLDPLLAQTLDMESGNIFEDFSNFLSSSAIHSVVSKMLNKD